MVGLATMPEYEAYKDSGEGWISDVPEHWDVKKLKHIFFEKKHTQNMSLNCGSISFGKVITKEDEKIPHSTKESYQEVLHGEFLINPLNLNYDLISLRIGLSGIDVVVSAGYIVLKNKVDMSKEYFKYLLHRYDVAYMKLLGSGVRQTINFNHIANSLLLQPPMEEQTAIANFLDQKTAKIDQAIVIKEQQIALLKERKQIFIQQAVTQGLNPKVPMKDSGVEWIGQIPKHWEVKKLKRLATLSPPGSVINKHSKKLVCFLPMEKISVDGYICCAIKIPIKKVSQGFTAFARNDVIVAKITPCFENGKSAFLNKLETKIGYGSTEFYVLRPSKSILGQFLYYVVSSNLFLKTGEGLMTGSAGQKRVPTSFMANFPVFFSSINEQTQIVNSLDVKINKIKQAIKLQQNQIENLKEYKTTLINSAVTGKIKVA